MSDLVYLKAWEAAWKGDIDWVDGEVRAIGVDVADYTVNATTHEFLSDVPSGARVTSPVTISTGKSTTNGTISLDDFTFPSVTGDPFEAIIFYMWSGSDASSRLVCYRDTAISGLPVTPNGGDVNILFDSYLFTHNNP